jgi:hypothetical protein
MRNRYKVLSEKYKLVQEDDKEDVLAGLSTVEYEHNYLLSSIGKHYIAYYITKEDPFLSKNHRYSSIPDSVGTIDTHSVESGYLQYFTDRIFYSFKGSVLFVYIIDETMYDLYKLIVPSSTEVILKNIIPRLIDLGLQYKPEVDRLTKQYEDQM